jgi:formate C-acetyltransferase
MQTACQPTPTLGRPVPEASLRFLAGARDRMGAPEASPKESNWTHAFFDLYAAEPLRRRQALAFAYALENEPVRLFPRELLTGQVCSQVPGSGRPDLDGTCDPRWREFAARPQIALRQEKELPELEPLTGGRVWVWSRSPPAGHIGWRWDWIVAEGIEGMLARVARAEPHVDEPGRAFLEGVCIVVEALGRWADRHVEALEAALGTAVDEVERTRLQERIRTCGRVPRQGARTFREAVQSFHLSYLATMFENPHGGNGPGRLDYFLWPWLERDLAEGRITPEETRLLVDELFIRIHERIHKHDGTVETVVVGGTHPDGRSAFNPLSRIMIESIAGLGVPHPAVYIRMPDDLPDEVMDLAARDICEGGNRAQIVYDGAIVRAMTQSGIPEAHARMYMCGGCMEISPHGMNGDLLFCGFFNMLKVMELVLNGGVCLLTGERRLPHLERDLADYRSFEDLYGAFAAELRRLLEMTFRQLDLASEAFAAWRPAFLVSGQVEDCIARGRGLNDRGARGSSRGATSWGRSGRTSPAARRCAGACWRCRSTGKGTRRRTPWRSASRGPRARSTRGGRTAWAAA